MRRGRMWTPAPPPDSPDRGAGTGAGRTPRPRVAPNPPGSEMGPMGRGPVPWGWSLEGESYPPDLRFFPQQKQWLTVQNRAVPFRPFVLICGDKQLICPPDLLRGRVLSLRHTALLNQPSPKHPTTRHCRLRQLRRPEPSIHSLFLDHLQEQSCKHPIGRCNPAILTGQIPTLFTLHELQSTFARVPLKTGNFGPELYQAGINHRHGRPSWPTSTQAPCHTEENQQGQHQQGP